MVLGEKDGGELRELLKEHQVIEHRQVRLPDEEVLVRILLDAEQSEAVLDLLEERYAGGEGHRVVILPVEATLPRAEPEPADAPKQPAPDGALPERIPARRCTRTSKMLRGARGSIWRWWRCPPSLPPSGCGWRWRQRWPA